MQDWAAGHVCNGTRPLQPVHNLLTVQVGGGKNLGFRVLNLCGGVKVRVGGRVRVKLLCKTGSSPSLGMGIRARWGLECETCLARNPGEFRYSSCTCAMEEGLGPSCIGGLVLHSAWGCKVV